MWIRKISEETCHEKFNSPFLVICLLDLTMKLFSLQMILSIWVRKLKSCKIWFIYFTNVTWHSFLTPINPILWSFQKGIRDSKCQSIQFSVLFRKGFGIQNASLGKEEIIITILIEKKRKQKKRNESELKQITGTRFKNVSLVVLFPLTLLTLRIFMVYSVSAVMVQ